jgi:hypothetical protein
VRRLPSISATHSSVNEFGSDTLKVRTKTELLLTLISKHHRGRGHAYCDRVQRRESPICLLACLTHIMATP